MPKTVITPEPEIPETVNINGVDYSPEDASNLIELGKHTQEREKEWNTKIDNVWPEYTRLTQEQKNWQTEKQGYEEKLKNFQEKKDAGVETPADVTAAKEAARKLGLTLNEDLDQRGYIKKEDLPGILSNYSQEQEAIKKILDEGSSLEKEIDGTDGRPPFNRKVVLAYANAYNIPDLKAAYEDMNKPQLDAWKAHQVESQRSKGLKTISGGGVKSVKEMKVSDDNVKDLLHEAVMGGGEE